MKDKRPTIISKAVELYHQYGIKSVSMDDIAREIGMSKKTLYQAIHDKNELVESVVDHYINLVTELLSVFHNNDYNAIEQHSIHAKKVIQRFPRYNPSMLFDLRKYYPTLLRKLNEHRYKETMDANILNLKKGIKEGYYLNDINPHIIAKIMLGYQQFLFDSASGLLDDNELADPKTYEEVYKYHFRGICTPEGIVKLDELFNHKT
nr:TetR/AcrR family transcriptional regulator [uncultured Carboxylicivirga sp.]